MTSVEVNLKELARPCYTENFTGADLKALLFNAQLKVAHAALDQRRRTRMDSIASSPTPTFPISPLSSPAASVKNGCSDSDVMTFTYHSDFGARRHSVVPEEVEEKVGRGVYGFSKNSGCLYLLHLQVEILLGRERGTFVPQDSNRFEERGPSRVSRGGRDRILLTQDTLLVAIQDTRPSVSEEERRKYSRM